MKARPKLFRLPIFLFFCGFILVPAFLAPAEELRTLIAGTVSLSPELQEGTRLTMGYADAVAILLPKESPFILGFEIELKTPPAALSMPGALAWELWRRIDPVPDKSRYSYDGVRVITQPLPARAGLVVQVPMRKDHGLKSGPYATVIPFLAESKDFPVVFKLFPVTKGLPPELEAAQFQVRVRPILTDEGAFRLIFHYPETVERSALQISVDDKRLPEDKYLDGKEMVMLKAGSHTLRIVSDAYRDETRTFSIEQGRILDISIELQDTMPLVVIEAPDSAQVSVDGNRIDHMQKPSFTVDPGEHSLNCCIGDYVITRKFTAFRGKTYKIILSVELEVQESP